MKAITRTILNFTFKISAPRSALLSLAFAYIFLISPAMAQVISLDNVLHAIETRNPMLKEYDEKVKAINLYAGGATSWMAPMIGAGTFMMPYDRDEAMHENEKGAWMFSFEQDIPNPWKINANKKYLSSRAAVEEQGRSVQFNQLRTEARIYYFKWLVAEEKRKVLVESEQIIGLMLKLARIRYPYNQGNLGSIYKAEGRLTEVQNMMLMTDGDIEQSAFRLKSLMNIPGDAAIMIDTSTNVSLDPMALVNDTSALSIRRSDIRRIDKTIETMRLNQSVQRSLAKPDFRIRFDHMKPVGDMPSQFSAMAMVSIPIAPWSSKMYRSEKAGMQYDIQAMEKNREAILNDARGMLAGMSAQLGRMRQQLENYKTRIIPSLDKNYQTVMVAYEENREQLPMVIDAWETLNMAQMDYLEKRWEYLKMIIDYQKELER
jgi:outer membrane protein, heavy metal efflux system